MKNGLKTLLIGGIGIATLTVGGVGTAMADNEISLTIDGQQETVHHFGGTINDMLDKRDIHVTDHDQVIPDASQQLHDGENVTVRYGRQVTAIYNGEPRSLWTTSYRMPDILAELQVAAEAALSVDRSMTVGREGITFTAVTPRNVTLVVDGTTRQLVSTDPSVGALLANQGVTLGADDETSAPTDSLPTEGMTLAVKRGHVEEKTVDEAIKFTTVKEEDASMSEGTTKVKTPGVDGARTVTYRIKTLDGQEAKREELSQTVHSEPTAEVVIVGTKKSADGPINLANEAMWDRVAQCESTGNWSINTGNGYSGGLQFAPSTWAAYGGTAYAASAYQATREQQITIANKIYATSGLSQWGCKA